MKVIWCIMIAVVCMSCGKQETTPTSTVATDAGVTAGDEGESMCGHEASLVLWAKPCQGALELAMINHSSNEVTVIDAADPTWWVVRATMTDQNGKVFKTTTQTDWLLFAPGVPRVVKLKPNDGIIRTIKLRDIFSVPPGEYTVDLKYIVQRDSYFLEPWLKPGILTSRGRATFGGDRSVKLAKEIWLGEVTAPPVKIHIGEDRKNSVPDKNAHEAADAVHGL